MTPVNMVDEAAWIECLNTMQGNLSPYMSSSARQKFDHISTIPGRNQGGREADAGFGAQPQLNRLVSRRRSRPRSGARSLANPGQTSGARN